MSKEPRTIDWYLGACQYSFDEIREFARDKAHLEYLWRLLERIRNADVRSIESYTEYSLLEYAESQLASDLNYFWGAILIAQDKKDVGLGNKVFHQMAVEFSRWLHDQLWNIDIGMPIYEKNEDGKLEELTEDSQLGYFMFQYHNQSMPNTLYEPPEWASKVYIRSSDARDLNLFFWDHYANYRDEDSETERKQKKDLETKAIRLRKTAYRRYLEGTFPGQNTPRDDNLSDRQPDLHPKERNTLLILLAAMFNAAEVDICARAVAKKIVGFVSDIGVAISDDTVRDVLRKIPDAVEARQNS